MRHPKFKVTIPWLGTSALSNAIVKAAINL